MYVHTVPGSSLGLEACTPTRPLRPGRGPGADLGPSGQEFWEPAPLEQGLEGVGPVP